MSIERVTSLTDEEWALIDNIEPCPHEIAESDIFLVKRIDALIVGYLKRDYLGHVHAVFINRDFRGQKIGPALLSDCEGASKIEGVTELSAGVRNNNSAAIKLFTKNGFSCKDTGNDYVMFTKRLS